jgi:hypothetical protein
MDSGCADEMQTGQGRFESCGEFRVAIVEAQPVQDIAREEGIPPNVDLIASGLQDVVGTALSSIIKA